MDCLSDRTRAVRSEARLLQVRHRQHRDPAGQAQDFGDRRPAGASQLPPEVVLRQHYESGGRREPDPRRTGDCCCRSV
jgi:hypothetical protein